jgi:CRISPR/Cas system CMR subunit Cmr4 (Cas7 group RAMP superfamily)
MWIRSRTFASEGRISHEAFCLIGGNPVGTWGLDAQQARNQAGRPIIPYSHIRGVLRHAAAAAGKDALFGVRGLFFGAIRKAETEDERKQEERNNEEDSKRARLILSDLVADFDGKSTRTTRVAIEDDSGRAKEGHLLVAELVAPAGRQVSFTGDALLWSETRDNADDEVKSLQAAAQAVFALGRFKTVGWGEVASIELSLGGEQLMQSTPAGTDKPFLLSFTLDRPFLVDAEEKDSNTLTGRPIIPGAAIKGALAEHMRRRGLDPDGNDFGHLLSHMTVGHAVPMLDGKPVVGQEAEDFVAWDGEMRVARWPDFRMPDPACLRDLPFFPTDWKADKPEQATRQMRDAFPGCDTEVRTRVRINPERQAAEEGALFTQTLVCPTKDGRPVTWQARITPPEMKGTEPAQVARIMAALFDGPATLGKTNARLTGMSVVPLSVPAAPKSASGKFRVELVTPALMIRASHLQTTGSPESSSLLDLPFAGAFAKYVDVASGGTLRIAADVNPAMTPVLGPTPGLFVSTVFRGGFDARAHPFFGADIVEPFVLTDAGSVLYLEAAGAGDPGAVLARWASQGLPAMEWSAAEAVPVPADRWGDCPFLPQNGYGEVKIEGMP